MAENFILKRNRLESLNDLPENIILEIFTYLSVKELCIIRRVCKTWKRIVLDRSLWRSVDLRPYSFDLRNLGKLIRNLLSDALISFRLSGHMHEDKTTQSWKKSTVSEALLRDLTERCPKLKVFEMRYANVDISLSSFPLTIESLILTHSSIPCGWFKTLAENKDCLAKLTHLDLTESRKLTDSDLMSICRARDRLVVLKLNGCYRLTGLGLKEIMHLTDLVVLEMSATRCNDLSLHHLCRADKKLEELNLSLCAEIHDQSLEIVATLPRLRILNLEGCSKITGNGLRCLVAGCKELQKLNIKNTSAKSNEFEFHLPNCEIVCDEV